MNNIENMFLPTITVVNGIVTACNEVFTEQVGFNPTDIVGQTASSIVSLVTGDAQTVSDLEHWLSSSLETKQALLTDATLNNKYHYELPVKAYATPLNDDKSSIQLYFKILSNRSIDPITGLPNGWGIHSRADYLIDNPDTTSSSFVVLFLSVDNFSTINFRYGFDIGDDYILLLGKELQSIVKSLVVRFSNAKFGILIENKDELTVSAFQVYIEQICQKICTLSSKPMKIAPNIKITKSFSIGVSERNVLYESYHAMELAAETAMLQAKKFSMSKYCFSTFETPEDIVSKKLIIDEFPRAIEKCLINIHYQPQYELNTDKLIGLEALSRWNHASLGNITPDVFIEIAEEIGLHFDFDLWVITQVCTQIVDWRKQGIHAPKIAINISFKTIEMTTFIERLNLIIQQTACPTACIELEITETASANNMKTLTDNIFKVQELGISIAVDDFGCGYSSLSLIRTFHKSFDKLKLDRSLIENICNTTVDREFTRQIIHLGKVLDVKILAEGVEDYEQCQLLKTLGCDYAQGYYFDKALPKDKTEQLIKETMHPPSLIHGTS